MLLSHRVSCVTRAAALGPLLAAAVMLVVSPSWLSSQAPPAGARFQCKDGTYSTATAASQACSRHGGVAKALSAPVAAAAPAVAPAPAAAPVAAAAPRLSSPERGAFGLALGYAGFNTSYWFYGGGNSRWQSWYQIQASGFFDGRAPLRIGALQTRFRVEARIGTGGATNNAGGGYVGSGSSLTNGSLSGGLAATLRLPLSAMTAQHPIPYVGLGLDYSVLWGFGDNSGSIYGKGWNERILTVPLVVGLTIRTAHLTLSPEIRYAFLGSSSSNLYLPGAGYAMQNTGPSMKGIFVGVSWH
jgi:hypothetical protein